jgi:hypothetical protein
MMRDGMPFRESVCVCVRVCGSQQLVETDAATQEVSCGGVRVLEPNGFQRIRIRS